MADILPFERRRPNQESVNVVDGKATRSDRPMQLDEPIAGTCILSVDGFSFQHCSESSVQSVDGLAALAKRSRFDDFEAKNDDVSHHYAMRLDGLLDLLPCAANVAADLRNWSLIEQQGLSQQMLDDGDKYDDNRLRSGSRQVSEGLRLTKEAFRQAAAAVIAWRDGFEIQHKSAYAIDSRGSNLRVILNLAWHETGPTATRIRFALREIDQGKLQNGWGELHRVFLDSTYVYSCRYLKAA